MTTIIIPKENQQLFLTSLVKASGSLNNWLPILNYWKRQFDLQEVVMCLQDIHHKTVWYNSSTLQFLEKTSHINQICEFILESDVTKPINNDSKIVLLTNEIRKGIKASLCNAMSTTIPSPSTQSILAGEAVYIDQLFESDGHRGIIFLFSQRRKLTNLTNQLASILHAQKSLITIALHSALRVELNKKQKQRSKALVNGFRIPLAVFNERGELWTMNKAMSHLCNQLGLEFTNNRLQITDQDSYKKKNKTYSLPDNIKTKLTTKFHFSTLSDSYTTEENSFNGVAVFAINPELQKQISPEKLKLIFNLTKTEAEIALLIMQGVQPKKIALNRNVSVHTVRDHIKTIYKKTGCCNQLSLANLLCSIPVN